MRKFQLKNISIVLTTALVLTACSATGSTIPETETDQTYSTEAASAEESSAAPAEEETETGSADPEDMDAISSENGMTDTDSSEAGTEETTGSETEDSSTEEEVSTVDASDPEESTSVEETTGEPTKAPETTKAPEPTKVPETTKAPEPTKVQEPTKAPVKAVSISATVNGNHYIGDTLGGADFTVVVTMSDGSKLTNPAGWAAAPLTLSAASTQITVSYGEASTQITVNAAQRPAPTKAPVPTQAPAQPTQAPQPTAAPTPTLEPAFEPYWDLAMAKEAFEIQNQYRAEAGVEPLIWDDKLYELACIRAQEISVDYPNNFNHARAFICTGENAAGPGIASARLFMEGWKESPPHYGSMILSEDEYGAIAFYKAEDGGYYAISLFQNSYSKGLCDYVTRYNEVPWSPYYEG